MNLAPSLGFLAALAAASAVAAPVQFKEDSITLPTYAPGGYDKTPLFYTGRVYQGAQGRVYPYPMQDVLHDERADEVYKYLTLENDWLQMGLLPEHGGHLLNFTDKATGFETFYRQHVVKPALIGMLGAWISGGVEWNFPHHHRPTTSMPIDWTVTKGDGGRTIWIGETELFNRLKWTIGLSLLKDRAVLQAENRFMNRQPYMESMLYWANVSVHCGDDYQVIFPPSCHLGFDHHKNFWTSFPIGPKRVDHNWLVSQRSKYAEDVDGMTDLSWWKNFTVESRSIFAMDPENAWIAGYDHARNAGTAHVSNRHLTVGKKFFLWGNFPEAHVWDKVLTDEDGPYLELMVGCWSDNQPDYSWIAPYETRTVKQFWFPVKGIGGVKHVTIDGAVNLQRLEEDRGKALLGFHSTRTLEGCTVELLENGVVTFDEKNVTIDPNRPWCKTVPCSADAADQALTGRIRDASGKVFLAYTPVPADPHDPLPAKVANPKPPAEIDSAEVAYLSGLRLEQFRNGLVDPEPYYRRALEIDPGYSAANVALATRWAKNTRYADAEKLLRTAVARVTRNYTRARDAEPEHMLALVLREQAFLESDPTARAARLKEAEDLFWRVTWRSTMKKEAFVEITRLAALRGDWQEAHEVLEFSALPLAACEAKLHTLHAFIHRRLVTCPDATKFQLKKWKQLAENNQLLAFRHDPLEVWGQVETAFRKGGVNVESARKGIEAAVKNRGLAAQQLLEVVCDYYGLGAWDEVVALTKAADEAALAQPLVAADAADRVTLKDTLAACRSLRNPMFAYFRAAALERLGEVQAAGETIAEAAAMPTDYCFPSRHEEYAVLDAASRLAPERANTWYYLGCLLWNADRKRDAVSAWYKCIRNDCHHALAYRCLGFAAAHPGTCFTNTGVPGGVASREAHAFYLKSLACDANNFRVLEEADKVAEKLGIPAAKRLELMQRHRATAEKYDACILRMAYLFNEVGKYDEALEILKGRKFHVWEGGEGLLGPFVDASLLRGLQKMSAGDHAGALELLRQATTYPENLQAGRPGDAGTEPKARYWIARCLKASGDAAGYRAELEKAMNGWVHAGEMNYYRILVLRELAACDGREPDAAAVAAQFAELDKGIATLEKPQPKIIDAYAKFGGENSPMERQADNVWKARYLRALKAKAMGDAAAARKLFDEIAVGKPSLLWARYEAAH